MTHLRKMMLEELERRNYTQSTTRAWQDQTGSRRPPQFPAPASLSHDWEDDGRVPRIRGGPRRAPQTRRR